MTRYMPAYINPKSTTHQRQDKYDDDEHQAGERQRQNDAHSHFATHGSCRLLLHRDYFAVFICQRPYNYLV